MVKKNLRTANQLFTKKNISTGCGLLLIILFVANDARLIRATTLVDLYSPVYLLPAYIAGFTLILILLLSRNTIVRKVTEVLVFSAIYTDLLYLMLSGYPFSYPDAINLFNNPEYASAAFATFKIPFLLAFVGTGVIFAVVRFALKGVQSRFSPLWMFVFLVVQVLLFIGCRSVPGLPDLAPSVYRVSANLLSSNNKRPETRWRRQPVAGLPEGKKVDHVFVIVDESVTGSALSINGFKLPTTPFLQTSANNFINFGIATSFTNFSAGSNLALMSGLKMRELPDTSYTAFAKPGLFRYAKQAGYTTYLLDAQTPGDKLQNYTTSQDLRFIDTLYKPSSVNRSLPLYARDSVLAEKIAAIASSNVPTFTYVNKFGAHWPYDTNYPDDSLPNSFTAGEYNATATHYFRSLRWNVDRFWQILMDRLPATNKLLIIYTADHGEDYDAAPLKIKHASIYQANDIEGLVPLLALDRANFFPSGYTPLPGRYSHEYIFPTLLLAMGYKPGFVTNKYGYSLLGPVCESPRWFQTGDLFGRGTNKRVNVDTKSSP